MPTQVILDPLGSTANVLYGVNFGVPSIHDPSVQYDAVYFGLGGADAIYDTDANGWIWAQAGDGSSFIGYGNGGDDVVVTFDGNDWLFGGAGNDILIANDGNDALIGEAGNDQLWGGTGSDQMNGGVGSDLLVGDAGTDFMVAGVDNDRDVMIGGPSGDEYIVARGGVVTGYSLLEPVPNPSSAGANIIWGFEIGIDVLKLPNANSVGGPLTGTSGERIRLDLRLRSGPRLDRDHDPAWVELRHRRDGPD